MDSTFTPPLGTRCRIQVGALAIWLLPHGFCTHATTPTLTHTHSPTNTQRQYFFSVHIQFWDRFRPLDRHPFTQVEPLYTSWTLYKSWTVLQKLKPFTKVEPFNKFWILFTKVEPFYKSWIPLTKVEPFYKSWTILLRFEKDTIQSGLKKLTKIRFNNLTKIWFNRLTNIR